MAIFYHPYFLLQVTLYVWLYIVKHTEMIMHQWIQNYLADLLCLPIVLSIALFVLRTVRKIPNLTLSKAMVLVAWIYFSLIFELLFPWFSNKYASDWLDVMMYGLGGIFYYYVQMPQQKPFKYKKIKF